MYEPEVTIITPTYNIVEAEKTDDFYLQINLLDKQTYPYIEHIVMDNASTDGTQDLLKEYKNSGYINFLSAPDSGKYDAINKGIVRAKGKYIGILSCDDFYHDITGIANVVEAMEREEADFCFFTSYCRQPDGNAFLYIPSMLNVFQVMPCSHQAIIFKKEVLDKLSGFDAKFKIMADYDLMLRLILGQYRGIFFENNIVTYNMGEQALKYSVQVEAECNHIFYKNYKGLYNLSNEALDRMVNLSEIPRPLLDKLAKFFPDDTELFYERYEQMYNMRLENAQRLREQERNNRAR